MLRRKVVMQASMFGVGVVGLAVYSSGLFSVVDQSSLHSGAAKVEVVASAPVARDKSVKESTPIVAFGESSGVKPKNLVVSSSESHPVQTVEKVSSDSITPVQNRGLGSLQTAEVSTKVVDLSHDVVEVSSLPEPVVHSSEGAIDNPTVVDIPYRPSTDGALQQVSVTDNTPVVITNEQKNEMQYMGSFLSTAYDLGYDSCLKYPWDPDYGVTASGVSVKGMSREQAMVVAVDPNLIPLGSKLYVEYDGIYASYSGVYTAYDVGGAINGNHIDLFMGDYNTVETSDAALEFGRRTARVYLIM